MDKNQIKLAEELLFSEEKPLSAAKLLYQGLVKSSFSPFPLNSPAAVKEADHYLNNLKKQLDAHLDPIKIDREASIPPETIKILAEIGLFGMSVPKEHGGLGMSQTAYCRAIEEVSSRCGSTAILINAHQSIGLKAILLFGTDAQKERYLPALSKGETIAAFSLTEPNAGSDASGIETRAVYDPARKLYTINGKKQWTSNGSIAGVITLMAKTEIKTPKGIEDKVTAFIVTPDMPGFIITNPGLEKVGVRGTRTTNIALENLEVPEENILGPLGGGLKVCLTALDFGRVTFGAMCLGSAKFCLEKALYWSVERRQFGRPLASFTLVKKKLAEMSALALAIESTTYLTAGLIDSSQEDVMLESAILKVFASEALWKIIYETMQIYGGRSFFTDHPFERLMRDARLNMIGEGSNEVLRAFISAVGLRELGMPLKKALRNIFKEPVKSGSLIFSAFQSYIGMTIKPIIPNNIPDIQGECDRLAHLLPLFAKNAINAIAEHKENVVEQQLLLNKLTNMAIAFYTSFAVISRVNSPAALPPVFKHPQKIAKYYLRMSIDQIQKNLNHIEDDDDADVSTLSKLLTGI